MLVDGQGIDDLSEISLLVDEEVEDICKLVRRPGGNIVNPNVDAVGQPAEIPVPGQVVSMRAVTNFKLVAYFVRHCNRTRRLCVPGSVTLTMIREIHSLRDEEMAYNPPSSGNVPVLDSKNWSKNIEAIVL